MNYLHKLSNYNYWANEKLLIYFNELSSTLPPSCLYLFSHIFNAQSIWIARIFKELELYTVFQEHTLEECKQIHKTTSEGLEKLLQSPDLNLQAQIIYKNSKGVSFNNSLEDILLQVFNHGTYHRAQIAKELRLNQIEPINTDYIMFVREA